MATQIINAAPMVIDHGIQDDSIVNLFLGPRERPQHIPKFYFFAQKGDTNPKFVTANELYNEYGIDSFDLRGKYANMVTPFILQTVANANAFMAQRIVPEDAGPVSNVIIYLDVLETSVDVYERNEDGSIKLDALGDPIVLDSTPGFKVKWVAEHATTEQEVQDLFASPIKPGDQVDTDTNTQSNRYPIFAFKVSSKGAFGNNAGFSIWAPNTKNTSSMPTRLMAKNKTYPYMISFVERPDETSTAKPTTTIFGEKKVMGVFKPMSIDPLTSAEIYFGETLIDQYRNVSDTRYPLVTGTFSEFHIFQENLELLLTKFQEAEVPFLTPESDFTEHEEDKHLFNFISGTDSKGIPYNSYVFVDGPDSIRFSEHNHVFAAGGSDGTMSDEVYAELVGKELDRYLDPDDPLQELAQHIESHFYDPGLPLDIKLKACNFISVRHDTMVCLSTHVFGEDKLSAGQDHASAISLRTRLMMMPESEYFGTGVVRGIIIGGSYKLRNSQWKHRVPLLLELLHKSARFMGASNGRWRSGFGFSRYPYSLVELGYDVSVPWVPNSVRNRNWDVGLNWVQAFDTDSYFFPAFKTVYVEDTSILTSYINACGFCTINKILHDAWRHFSGADDLTNAQLTRDVNRFVIEETDGIFDGRLDVEPNAMITDMDFLRGFSWTLPVNVAGNNQKTVMTAYAVAGRRDTE